MVLHALDGDVFARLDALCLEDLGERAFAKLADESVLCAEWLDALPVRVAATIIWLSDAMGATYCSCLCVFLYSKMIKSGQLIIMCI